MVTNPNTLGLFEEQHRRVADVVHARGGLVYMDGANMNALLGVAKPGDMGVDVMQFNLHKTFSTPHGGGGPGAGPVAVRDVPRAVPAGAAPRAARRRARVDDERRRRASAACARSSATSASCVRALTYIARAGRPGPRGGDAAGDPERQLPARAARRTPTTCAFDEPSMHECVFTDKHAEAARRADARRRQAAARLRLLRADHLLPAGREGRA